MSLSRTALLLAALAAPALGGDTFVARIQVLEGPLPPLTGDMGWVLAMDADVAVASAPYSLDGGAVHVLERNAAGWTMTQRLSASGAPPYAKLGSSLAVDGDTIAAGAIGGESASVFVRVAGSWVLQQELTVPPSSNPTSFGCAVALGGDTLFVGALARDLVGLQSGSVFVYQRNGGTWSPLGELSPSDAHAYHHFGSALALEGDTLLVAAAGDGDAGGLAGAVYVFGRSGSVWTERQKLIGSDTDGYDGFGCSLALSGERLVVGTTGAPKAYAFERAGGAWSQVAMLSPADPPPGFLSMHYGVSVALDRNRALVGAPVGAWVAVFERRSSGWTQTDSLARPVTRPNGLFGQALGVQGDILMVGAPHDSPPLGGRGRVVVYDLWPTPGTFCDSTDSAPIQCPCGNIGDPDAGCDNSAGTGGALARAQSFAPYEGRAELRCSGLPPSAALLTVLLRSRGLEPVPLAYGDGLLCAGVASLARLGSVAAQAGTVTHSVLHDGGPGTFHYQVAYRDAASYCTPAPLNASNGLTLVW